MVVGGAGADQVEVAGQGGGGGAVVRVVVRMVDLEPGRSLVDLGGLLMDLAELLGVDVDVVTEAGLAPRARERVLAEAVPL